MTGKTKLLKKHKELLLRFAQANVTAEKEKNNLAEARKRAIALIVKDVEKKYPPKDMETLQKYQVAKPDTCIRGATSDGKIVGFNFNSDEKDQAPICPHRYCSTRAIPFTKATVSAIERAGIARDDYHGAKRSIVASYRALIYQSKTFEEVLEVWSGAEALREEITGTATAITTLSAEEIKKIKKTNIKRKTTKSTA